MTSDYQHISHGFEPVFDGRSRVLVLGSFPSVLSRENAFYYGNPQNRFWRVIAACVGEPVPPNEGEPLSGDGGAALPGGEPLAGRVRRRSRNRSKRNAPCCCAMVSRCGT